MSSVKGQTKALVAGIVACTLFLVLAYGASRWGGDLLPVPVWFATASTVSLALALPRSFRWPVIVGGAVAGNLLSAFWIFDETLRSLLTPGLSVLLEIVFAVLALEHVLQDSRSIRRTKRALKILGIAILAGCLGATIATIETASPVINDPWTSWSRWALGDVVGLIILVPLALSYRVPLIVPRHTHFRLEAIVAFSATVASTVVSFNVDYQLVYVVLPAILWLAIRFGPRLASPAAMLTVMVGTYFSGLGSGPFIREGSDAILQVQGFALAVGICALLGGAHAVRAWDDQQQLGAILRALPDVIAVRDDHGELINSWIPADLAVAAQGVVEQTTSSDNPLGRIKPGQLRPTRIVSSDGSLFEQRVAEIDGGRSLYLYRDMTSQDRLDRALHAQKEEIARSRLHEQTRIGRLLHDGPIQELAAATLLIGLVKHDSGPEHAERLQQAERLTAEAIGDLRTMADLLVPPNARAGELGEALVHFGRVAFIDQEIVIQLEDSLSTPIAGDSAEALYLVGREALANVAFHSGASEVSIVLSDTTDGAILEILDNGSGLPGQSGDGTRHFGVQLMHERIEERGGELLICSRDDGGVSVLASIPTDVG